jgi:hypothetical protein
MRNNNKMSRIKLFIGICAIAIFGIGGAVPVLANADTLPQPKSAQQTVCQALDQTDNCTQAANSPQSGLKIDDIIAAIVNIFTFVIGVVAVIMVMVAGYRYVTSGGDSSKVSGAKSTITYALIGIAVAALAQGIVRFVLKSI